MFSHGKAIIRGNRGRVGRVGKSIYELWLETHSGTEEDFLEDMRSKIPGRQGPIGYSIFEQWNIERVERGEEPGSHDCFIHKTMHDYFGDDLLGDVLGNKIQILHTMMDLTETNQRIEAVNDTLCKQACMSKVEAHKTLDKRLDIMGGVINNIVEIEENRQAHLAADARLKKHIDKLKAKDKCTDKKMAEMQAIIDAL